MRGKSPSPSPSAPIRKPVIALLIGAAVCVLVLDQFVKLWVTKSLPYDESVPVLGGFLQLHYVANPGAAFSFATGSTWIFTIAAVAVAIFIAVSARRIRSVLWGLVLGLVLGGVLGNLSDRLFRPPGFGVGHVVDFILTPWMMPAIYNIADMSIVTSMCAIVLLTIFGVRFDGTREKRRAESTVPDPEADGREMPDTRPAESSASDDRGRGV